MSAPLTDASGKSLGTGVYEIDGQKIKVESNIIDGSDGALGNLPSPPYADRIALNSGKDRIR